jgi:hypothetical protein
MTEASRIRMFMGKAMPEQAGLATRKLALGALSGLVLRTPVDTGRARGAWAASIGGSSPQPTGSADKSGSGTITTGAAVIARQVGFQSVTIENNVPYIIPLNDGHSGQAPAGYVESTLSSLGLGVGRDG